MGHRVVSPTEIVARFPDGSVVEWNLDLTDEEQSGAVRHLMNYLGTPTSQTLPPEEDDTPMTEIVERGITGSWLPGGTRVDLGSGVQVAYTVMPARDSWDRRV